MAYRRTALSIFELKNTAYTNAIVTFYEADPVTGTKTDTLATLYDSYTGGNVITNPYQLNSNGMSTVPLYYDTPIVAEINSSGVGEHQSGAYFPISRSFRDDWNTDQFYLAGDIVRDGAYSDETNSIYVCTIEHQSGTWSVDTGAGKWEMIVDASSATAAASSASAAATSATAAATSAASSATQAAASYSYAEEAHTWRDSANNEAIAAAASATAASSSAAAAAASAASLVSIAGFQYSWSTDTSASDPTTGKIKANNATLSSATAIYISETTASAQAITAEIATWDDSTSGVRGKLRLVKASDPTVFAIFNVTGTVTDNGTWDTLTVSYVTGAGAFSASDTLYAQYLRNGDAGTSGWAWADDDGTTPTAPSATGTNALAIGSGAAASGTSSISFGTSATASANDAIAIGRNADATQTGAIAIGGATSDSASADATGIQSIAVGSDAAASAQDSTAIGSYSTASAQNAVAFGQSATASGVNSVAIGSGASTSGTNSVAIGESANGNNASQATVIGKSASAGSGTFNNIAIGYSSTARLSNECNINPDSASSGTKYSIYKVRGTTSNGTPTEIFLGATASARLTVPSDSTFGFKCYVAARRTDVDNESAFYELSGCIDNNAGTTALVGTVTKTVHAEDTAAWDVNITADNTNDAIAITVTGEAAKTISWLAMVETFEITG